MSINTYEQHTWNCPLVDIRSNNLLQLVVSRTFLEAHVEKITQIFCKQV